MLLQIPPVRIPYFDPQTGTYNVAQSNEISITVKPAGKVTAFDAELSSDTKLKNRLLNNPHGIRHNNLSLALLNKTSTSPTTLVIMALLIPALIFFIFVLSTKDKRLLRNDPAKFKSINAYKAFSRYSISDLTELEKATRNYFADKLNIMPDAHTHMELKSKLSLTETDFQTLRELYQIFDSNRFSPHENKSELTELVKKASALIQKIEGELKNA